MEEIEVCKFDDLEENKPQRIDIEGYRLLAIRLSDGTVKVADDECSHQDYSLAEGLFEVDDCTIECPKHGAAFDLNSGEPQCLPATAAIAIYDATISDDAKVVIKIES